jgi:hypothetical protein
LSLATVNDRTGRSGGNHFFAYALEDRLLELPDPKPLPYQDRGPDTVDFSEYLPGA